MIACLSHSIAISRIFKIQAWRNNHIDAPIDCTAFGRRIGGQGFFGSIAPAGNFVGGDRAVRYQVFFYRIGPPPRQYVIGFFESCTVSVPFDDSGGIFKFIDGALNLGQQTIVLRQDKGKNRTKKNQSSSIV